MRKPNALNLSRRRRIRSRLNIVLLLGIVSSIAVADEADKFFDDSYVHEIRLTTSDANWHSTLQTSHANDSDDPYFPASFSCDGVTIEKIGIRMKGNSSFRVNSIKKSFKIDFDEYDEGNDELHFMGLKKLNLNNSYKDPTLLREKIFLDFASQYIPTIRCVHTRLYINDEYIGLYAAIEQVDKNFVQDRFGGDEDGNLYKGAASDDVGGNSDFGSDLAWEGSEASTYSNHYQLKTNEEENDFSGLVEMIDILNNGDPNTFPDSLEPVMDVNNVLAGLALDNLFSNHDSYIGSAHNFFIYQSDVTGQFSHILWDTNETFGSFTMYAGRSDMRTLDPFWMPDRQDRPLMEKLWENDTYSARYLYYLARMLSEGFDVESMTARIEELANLIRTDLYADPNKLYNNAAFEANLYSSYSGIYGLQDFVQRRATYLQGILDTYEVSVSGSVKLYVNEIMADNDQTIQDPDGEGFPDWFEIYNPNDFSVDMGGMYLTDSADSPRKWKIPEGVEIAAGGYLVFWADNDEDQGPTHTNFKLSSEGEEIVLYDTDEYANVLIDFLEFGSQIADVSYGRESDGSDQFVFSDTPTPGASNTGGSTITFLDHEVLFIDGQLWIDTMDWVGWLEVTYQPWIWSTVWQNWIYLPEELSDSTGAWIWIMNQEPVDVSGNGTDPYLGYEIQTIDGKQWIDTGGWLGWLEITDAPWVWSNSASSWIYIYEAGSTSSSIWFRIFR